MEYISPSERRRINTERVRQEALEERQRVESRYAQVVIPLVRGIGSLAASNVEPDLYLECYHIKPHWWNGKPVEKIYHVTPGWIFLKNHEGSEYLGHGDWGRCINDLVITSDLKYVTPKNNSHIDNGVLRYGNQLGNLNNITDTMNSSVDWEKANIEFSQRFAGEL